MNNPYIPLPVIIDKIITETAEKDIKSFCLKFTNPQDEQSFKYTPGQFAELSLLGYGESPIGIASSPTEKGFIKFTVMKTGMVTQRLHTLKEGDSMGVRGPLGNSYPIETMKGANIVIIGGGFAFTTLRSLITYLIHTDNRKNYGDITVVYGARNPGALIYKQELMEWSTRKDLKLNVTVDKGDENWKGLEGFVPAITEKVAPSAQNAYAIVCGPPIMIKFTLPVLSKLGFADERIINSLEMRMKCGVGKCGRCNIGHKYVCKDGPVFTLAELKKMPQEY